MLAKWGAVVAAVAAFAVGQPTSPGPPPDAPLPSPSTAPAPDPPLPSGVTVAIKIEHDGRLSITEQVVVAAGQPMTRRTPLRVPAGDDRDRIFTVHHLSTDTDTDSDTDSNSNSNSASRAEATADELVLRAAEGTTTFSYTVTGAVADLGDRQEVRWPVAGGWDVPLHQLSATLAAPAPPTDIACRAGPPGSDTPCRSALTDDGQILRVLQPDLPAGHRVDLAVALPAGTVEANARFDAARPSPFALTPVSGVGLGLLALVLVGGFALLWLARGRDARAVAAATGPVALLVTEADRVVFASPDGVLPGEVGTVVDEHVDVADVTATVVDLAVRNYLSLHRTGEDWTIRRRNPPDDALADYERAAYTALLQDADEVSLAALRARRLDLAPVRDGLYAGVVRHGWFARRPDHERTRWTVLGALLAGLGVAATVVLALTVGHALLGLALVVGGLGLVVVARSMPARTSRGSVLVQQLRGLLDYLRGAPVAAVPARDRAMVLARALPYAVVLGETEGWLAHVADLGGDRYWYDGDIADFPAFLRELDAVLAASGQLR